MLRSMNDAARRERIYVANCDSMLDGKTNRADGSRESLLRMTRSSLSNVIMPEIARVFLYAVSLFVFQRTCAERQRRIFLLRNTPTSMAKPSMNFKRHV